MGQGSGPGHSETLPLIAHCIYRNVCVCGTEREIVAAAPMSAEVLGDFVIGAFLCL